MVCEKHFPVSVSKNYVGAILQNNIFHTEYTYIWLLCLSIQIIDSDIIS
ncbi:MAG: hypothetical protein H6P94_1032, partial [Thermoplasmatales archaeon]|nr:hypothetical protein [Thermoplasmatales archaeon]